MWLIRSILIPMSFVVYCAARTAGSWVLWQISRVGVLRPLTVRMLRATPHTVPTDPSALIN